MALDFYDVEIGRSKMEDFSVRVSSSSDTIQRAKQLYTIECLGLKIVGQEQDAIIVRCLKEEVEDLTAFEWIDSVEKYDCFIVAIPH